jgi:hypothetical protein
VRHAMPVSRRQTVGHLDFAHSASRHNAVDTPAKRLYRIILIEKPMFKAEFPGQVRAQRLNPQALGGMVACRDEGDPRFIREVEILL